MASEKEQTAEERVSEAIRGLGLGHAGEREREDTTGYRGTKDGKPIESRPSDIEGLTAALAGKSADAPKEKGTPEAEAPETVEALAPAKEESQKPDVDADKIRRYLKLKGLSDTVLDAVPEEELVSMRASFLEADHQRARLLEETNELRAKTERQTPESAKEAEPNRMVPAATEELDAQLKSLVDDGELSESAAKTLSAAIAASTQAVLDQVQERLAPIEEQGATAKAAGLAEVQRVRETVRAEVGERFSGLDDPGAQTGLEETFALLAKQQRFADLYESEGRDATIRAIYEAAARANGHAESDPTEEGAHRRQRREDRDNGNPSTAQRQSDAATKLETTPEQIARKAIRKALAKPGAKW